MAGRRRGVCEGNVLPGICVCSHRTCLPFFPSFAGAEPRKLRRGGCCRERAESRTSPLPVCHGRGRKFNHRAVQRGQLRCDGTLVCLGSTMADVRFDLARLFARGVRGCVGLSGDAPAMDAVSSIQAGNRLLGVNRRALSVRLALDYQRISECIASTDARSYSLGENR